MLMRWKENQKRTGGSLEKRSDILSPLYRVVGCSWTICVAFPTVSLCFRFSQDLRGEFPAVWPWRVTWVPHMQRPHSQSSLDQSASPPGFGLPSAQRLLSIGFPILRKWTTLIDGIWMHGISHISNGLNLLPALLLGPRAVMSRHAKTAATQTNNLRSCRPTLKFPTFESIVNDWELRFLSLYRSSVASWIWL